MTSHLSLFFATSTSGRFVKLKSIAKISKYKSVQNLIKQLFHSRLLDMRLVRPRWLFTISYPTRAHGIIVKGVLRHMENSAPSSAKFKIFRFVKLLK